MGAWLPLGLDNYLDGVPGFGEKLAAKPVAVFAGKGAPYYASTAAVLALSWGFSALAIANGF